MTNELAVLVADRWPSQFNDVERLQRIKEQIDSNVESLSFLRSQSAAIKSNKHLTPAGQKDGIRKHIAQSTARAIKSSDSLMRETRNGLAAWRERLLPPAPDQNNAAAAALRADARSMARGMNPGQREMVLASDSLDTVLFQALTEGPAMLSGITEQQRATLRDNWIKQNHKADLRQIEQVEEALELFDATVKILRNEAQQSGGFAHHVEFAAFVDNAGS